MRHGSLFSGIGGFDLAAQWCGWRNIFQVEIDDFCQKVLAKNFPDVKRYKDIKEFDGTEYKGTIDVISGGVPCQPASLAGKRLGKADDRWLWDETLRVFEESGATWGVFENVEGLLTLGEGLEFELLLSEMENKGYEVQAYIIPACGVGAPHRRYRVWIVAHSNIWRCADVKKEQTEIISNQIGKLSLAKQGRNIEQCWTGQSDCHVTDSTLQRNGRLPIGTESKRTEFSSANSNVADPYTKRLAERKSQSGNDGKECETIIGNGWSENWYEVAARFCRVDDGVSNRVDRLKSLGNAIVPQVAFEIFKAINRIEHGKE